MTEDILNTSMHSLDISQHEDGALHPDPGPAHHGEALVSNPLLVQQEEPKKNSSFISLQIIKDNLFSMNLFEG